MLKQFGEIMDNIAYLPETVSLLIEPYYLAILNVFSLHTGDDAPLDSEDYYRDLYIKISRSILLESQRRSRKLKLPDQAKYLLTIYV